MAELGTILAEGTGIKLTDDDTNITVALNAGSQTSLDKADSAVQPSDLIDGTGLLVPSGLATGNEASANTTALGTAIAGAEGAKVLIPAGTYSINTLTISTAGAKILLAPDATLKLADGQNDTLLAVTGNGVSIEGGTFDGNAAGQSSTPFGRGVIRIQADEVTVRGTNVINAHNCGIYATHSDDLTIDSCTINAATEEAIFLHGYCNRYNIRGNRIIACVEDGIKVHGHDGDDTGQSNDGLIEGNAINYGDVVLDGDVLAIEIWGGCHRTRIIGNSCIGSTGGGSDAIFGVSCDHSDSVVVANNIVATNVVLGLENAGGKDVIFSGNVISDFTNIGVSISQTAPDRTVVTGNTLKNGGGSSYGLQAMTGVNHTITGNVFIDAGSRNVFLNGAGSNSNISGNTFVIKDFAASMDAVYAFGVNGIIVANNLIGPDLTGSSTASIGLGGFSGVSNSVVQGNSIDCAVPSTGVKADRDGFGIFSGENQANTVIGNHFKNVGYNYVSANSVTGDPNYYLFNTADNAGGLNNRSTDVAFRADKGKPTISGTATGALGQLLAWLDSAGVITDTTTE